MPRKKKDEDKDADATFEKIDLDDDVAMEKPIKKKRISKKESKDIEEAITGDESKEQEDTVVFVQEKPKKKRGRKPKPAVKTDKPKKEKSKIKVADLSRPDPVNPKHWAIVMRTIRNQFTRGDD